MTVPHLTFNDLSSYNDVLKRLNEDKNLLSNRVLDAIKYGIENDFLEVTLFDISTMYGSMYSITFQRDSWEEALTSAREFFEKFEEYEKCNTIQILLQKLNYA